MVGMSTFGRSLTGSFTYAMTPKSSRLAMTSVVMIGRRMNISERFMRRLPAPRP